MGSGEWGVGLRPTAYFLRPRHGVRHIIATRDEARPHAAADGRDAHPYRKADARTSRDAGPYLGEGDWLGVMGFRGGGLRWQGG